MNAELPVGSVLETITVSGESGDDRRVEPDRRVERQESSRRRQEVNVTLRYKRRG